jgi:hypothetical protein
LILRKLTFELATLEKENKILKLKNEELELVNSKLKRTMEGIIKSDQRNTDDESSFQIESAYPMRTRKK